VAGAAAVLVAAVLSASPAASGDDETPTIKQVMDKLHKGARSPLAQLKTALKAANPDWTKVQKSTKEMVTYGAALPKNDPPRGDKASFEKLATAYYDNAKALDEAAEKEDKQVAQAAYAKVSASCKACHSAHRGR
jgi:cytochrome c556